MSADRQARLQRLEKLLLDASVEMYNFSAELGDGPVAETLDEAQQAVDSVRLFTIPLLRSTT